MEHQRHGKRIVNIIGGFLGAGKTTLVNHLLSCRSSEKTDVLIREYGAISIDDKLIDAPDTDIHVFQGLSIHNDPQLLLHDYLERLFEEKKFDRLIIEASGLESPLELVRLFMIGHMPHHYVLGSYIAVVDAVYGEMNLAEYPLAAEQIALADALIINKADLATDGSIENLRPRLKAINALAHVFISSYARVEPAPLLNVDLYEQLKPLSSTRDETKNMDHIKSVVLSENRPMDKNKVNAWIQRLFSQEGQKILRSKGFFNFKGEDYRYEFQGVRKSFHSKADRLWQKDEERQSTVVLIGEKLEDEEFLKQSFSECV